MTILEKMKIMGFGDDSSKIIRSGKVMVNNEVVFTPSVKIKDSDIVSVKESKKWVSRGAYKLLDGIQEFNLSFKNKIVLDIGSSTGGFTDVSLSFGATKVYALDVGTNQLDYSLRVNEKVVVMEKTNLKTISPEMFQENIDIVVTDVSFISLKHVFNVLKNIGDDNFKIVALIKPQFECNSNQVQPGGFVPLELHDEIINKVKLNAKENGFLMKKIKKSSILGKKTKNQEYITLFERTYE